MVGISSNLKEAWNTVKESQDKREKIQALSLAKDCYEMKLEILTNATVVDDAIRFVSTYGNQDKIIKINENAEPIPYSNAEKIQSINTYNKVF